MNIVGCYVKTSAEAEMVRKYVKMCSRKGAKAYVHSFGCQLNVSDGEKIKGVLKKIGYSFTDIAEEAESDNLFLYGEKEEEEKNVKRNTYVAVLSVALVIAIIILVITLRRVPKEEDIDVSGAEENKNKKE